MRRWSCSIVAVALGLGSLGSQEPFRSGPQAGSVLPKPFDALVINGKVAEGRQHCLVCQNALNPAVLIFAREPDAKTEKPLMRLLEGVDKFLENDPENIGGFAVFLSPDAHSSVTDGMAEDTEKLLEEATKRFALVGRLAARAKPLKHVVVAAYPDEGPKGYNINKDAEVTVLLYDRLRVSDNWAFEKGKMTESDADGILKKVTAKLAMAVKKKVESQ